MPRNEHLNRGQMRICLRIVYNKLECEMSVYSSVCVCVRATLLRALNCFHMCLNVEFWAGLEDKGGEGAAVVGKVGSGFTALCSTSGLQAAELEFPRLKTHTSTVCTHLNEHIHCRQQGRPLQVEHTAAYTVLIYVTKVLLTL